MFSFLEKYIQPDPDNEGELKSSVPINMPGASAGEVYQVDDIYITTNSTNPATRLGYGTWTAFGAGRVLVGIDAGQTEFDTVEETGGAKTHTLTVAQMPSHAHVYHPRGGVGSNSVAAIGQTSGGEKNVLTDYMGGGDPHNNLQPYIVVYMWKRTA